MLPYLLIGGGVLVGLVALLWGVKLPALPSFVRKPEAAQEENTDARDLEAFKRLQARMARLKCKEGMAAVATVGQHFLHDAGAHE